MNTMTVTKNFMGFPGIIKFEETPIFYDNRGYFCELWNAETQKFLPSDFKVVQENLSNSGNGVARGLHFQEGNAKQAKFIQVLDGMVLDFWYRLDSTESDDISLLGKFGCTWLYKGKALFLPNNYAHGFVACNPNTKFLYKVNAPYVPGSARTINFKTMVLDYLKDIDMFEKENTEPESNEIYRNAKKMKEWMNTLLDAHTPLSNWEMSQVDAEAPTRVPVIL